MWPVEFTKSESFKFLVFLTETDKKLDTKNLRMAVRVVWKIYKKLGSYRVKEENVLSVLNVIKCH